MSLFFFILNCRTFWQTEVARILQNNRLSPSSYVKDPFEFEKISGLTESKQQILENFHEDNLYTNVLVNEAIEIALDVLFKRPTSSPISFNRAQLRELLNCQYALFHLDS